MSPLLSSSLHFISCLLALFLGLRFSRIFHLSPPSQSQVNFPPLPLSPSKPLITTTTAFTSPPSTHRQITGRHVISIRPWAHPNPAETLRAHRILSAVQSEQRRSHIAPRLPSPPRKFLVVTPTYSRTFQVLYLSSLAYSLLVLPFPLTWIVVEPQSSVNDTTEILSRFAKLDVLRLSYPGTMPNKWAERSRVEARMRLMALREIRHRQLDGIVVFADESNVHTMEFFDEAQMVKWIASASVGILLHRGSLEKDIEEIEKEKEGSSGLGYPIVGPACNLSRQFVGWHALDRLNFTGKIAEFVGEEGLVVPGQFEWAGFVMNSRLVWDEAEGQPDWVRASALGYNGDGIEMDSPLDLVKDVSFVEPLGSCGKKVLLWWVRAEARFDSKFPARWIIDKPLEITVPAKQTPWPESPPELVVPATPSLAHQNFTGRQQSKTGRSSRPRQKSRRRKKRDLRLNDS